MLTPQIIEVGPGAGAADRAHDDNGLNLIPVHD